MAQSENGASAPLPDDIMHLTHAVNDSLSDEIVTRLAGAATDGLDLLDQVNRSGVAKALPALTALVENGDLDRLIQLARVYAAAQDSLSDEIITRVAETSSEALSLFDRFNRGGGAQLVALVESLEASGGLEKLAVFLPRIIGKLEAIDRMLGALESASAATAKGTHARGGLGGLMALLRDKDNQDSLRHLINVGKALKSS
ncbi:MAG: hypothetical protein R3D57_20160 [Hyphomicrobiaceae bacterium]